MEEEAKECLEPLKREVGEEAEQCREVEVGLVAKECREEEVGAVAEEAPKQEVVQEEEVLAVVFRHPAWEEEGGLEPG